jgi:hypothetical protein
MIVAFEWKSLDRPVKVALVTGERQRDRVLNESEVKDYLCACPQPWKDCATIILDEGFRPVKHSRCNGHTCSSILTALHWSR